MGFQFHNKMRDELQSQVQIRAKLLFTINGFPKLKGIPINRQRVRLSIENHGPHHTIYYETIPILPILRAEKMPATIKLETFPPELKITQLLNDSIK